jgi:hypothetical protein
MEREASGRAGVTGWGGQRKKQTVMRQRELTKRAPTKNARRHFANRGGSSAV